MLDCKFLFKRQMIKNKCCLIIKLAEYDKGCHRMIHLYGLLSIRRLSFFYIDVVWGIIPVVFVSLSPAPAAEIE